MLVLGLLLFLSHVNDLFCIHANSSRKVFADYTSYLTFLVVRDTNLSASNLSASSVNVDLHKLNGWDFQWKMGSSRELNLLTISAIIILKSVN